MDNKSLLEIKNKLMELPFLEKKFKDLNSIMKEEESNGQSLFETLKAETADVENLKKESLSVSILKLFGKLDQKVSKETEEMFTAKLKYDKSMERVKLLKSEREELIKRISDLRENKDLFETELKCREERIKRNVNSEIYTNYDNLIEEQEELSQQIIEINEAVRAANKVIETAADAIENLNSAESWATFDVWTKGGIFSHMAKYDRIDSAQSDFNRLSSQMQDLNKELSDISITTDLELSGIDSTTRVIDFWFDNIFTDLNVRDRIREDNEKMQLLKNKLHNLVANLEKSRNDIHNKVKGLEQKKNDLLVSIDNL